MQIDTQLLLQCGAVSKRYSKNETIFNEEDPAVFYYQIQEGHVKMVNINNDGKEFVHGIFTNGQSFGEPSLFINRNYPAAAVAISPAIVLKLSKEKLFKLLDENQTVQKQMLLTLAQRLYDKSVTTREIIGNNPEGRILAFLKTMKNRAGNPKERSLVPYTRQEIANFTGLRVETVIRTLKHMDEEQKVSIVDHKLWF